MGTRTKRKNSAQKGPSQRDEHGGVQSVARALTLLEIIAERGGEASLTDIASTAKLNVSTCHHLLSTLVEKGYATRGPGRRSYALGARVLHLGQACLQRVDLPRRAQAVIDRINVSTGETIHLAILQGFSVMKVVKRDARHAIRIDAGSIGRSDAAHATATGKAILAWLSQDEIGRVLAANGSKRFTPNTITDSVALCEELGRVRRDGFAMDREEFLPDVICVAAVIRDHTGAPVGSLGASTPKMRATEAHLRLMQSEVMAAAAELSAELGAPSA